MAGISMMILVVSLGLVSVLTVGVGMFRRGGRRPATTPTTTTKWWHALSWTVSQEDPDDDDVYSRIVFGQSVGDFGYGSFSPWTGDYWDKFDV